MMVNLSRIFQDRTTPPVLTFWNHFPCSSYPHTPECEMPSARLRLHGFLSKSFSSRGSVVSRTRGVPADPGKYADFLVLNANPRSTISSTRARFQRSTSAARNSIETRCWPSGRNPTRRGNFTALSTRGNHGHSRRAPDESSRPGWAVVTAAAGSARRFTRLRMRGARCRDKCR